MFFNPKYGVPGTHGFVTVKLKYTFSSIVPSIEYNSCKLNEYKYFLFYGGAFQVKFYYYTIVDKIYATKATVQNANHREELCSCVWTGVWPN